MLHMLHSYKRKKIADNIHEYDLTAAKEIWFLSLQIENLINTHCGGLFTILSAI